MARYALLFAFFFFALPARAAEFDAKPLDAAIERAMKEMDVPGAAVVVVKDDSVIYLKAFGVKEKGKSDRVTTETVFPIASCSKAFTSTLIAMLVDEGKLNWDDRVHDRLDFFRLSDELADRDVTIRDLLCHRTGMPRHDMLWSGLSCDTTELIRLWGKGRPSTSFRSTWEYSNVPFTTAGVIAGKIEKSTWADAIEKRIFKPLGMKSSSCTWKSGFSCPDHATPHYYAFDKSIAPVKWDEIDHAGGAGCINSTATDLAQWLRFQIAEGKFGKKQLVSTRAMRETHTAQMLFRPEGPFALYFPKRAGRFHAYGLGWFVHDYRGFDCVSHGGTLTGIRTECMLVPEKKLGVFVLCNVRPSLFPEAVAKTALDQLLGLPAEDWVKDGKASLATFDFLIALRKNKRDNERKPDTKPSLPLKDYVGSFAERAYGRAEVTLDKDKLMVKWGRLAFRLDHYHFDTFTAIPIAPKDEIESFDRTTLDVQFRLGTNGKVEGMRFLDQEFGKVMGKK
ncbi:MAG TPA: serine hydrolase [Gemmata sp.]|nr:serine hydrolase [Gemmata sp.]